MSPSAFTAAIQPRRKHPGIVEYQQVSRKQQFREVAESAVRPLAGSALHMQHPGRIAGGKRLLGNEFVG